jgi:hypothetical protein
MNEELKKYIDAQVEQKVNYVVRDLRQQVADLLNRQKEKDAKIVMTYVEIAKEFRVSLKTLKLLKKTGLLIPMLKGGRHFLFERSHVIQVLQTRPRLKPQFLSN